MYQRNQLAMVHAVMYFLLKEKPVKWKSFIGDLFLTHHFPSPLGAMPVQYSNDSLSESLPCELQLEVHILNGLPHPLPLDAQKWLRSNMEGTTSSEHLFPHTRADLDKWQFSDLVEIQTLGPT